MNSLLARIIAAVLLLAPLPCAAYAERISAIAAIVNDDIITTYELQKEASTLLKELERGGAQTEQTKVRLRVTALNRLIDKKLVVQKIKELDIKISEEELRQAIEDVKKQNNLSQEALVAALRTQGLTFDEYKSQLKEQLERLRLVSQEVRAKIQVGEREMLEYYEANLPRFSDDERFHARHIFLRIPKDASATDIKRIMVTAASVYQSAKSGADFGGLAKKHSDDPSGKDGGDLGTFKKGEVLSDFSEALEKLKPGEVSELIATTTGFHIIKLEERLSGKAKPFAEVKAEIEDLLYKSKSEERFNQWLADLRKGAAIEIRTEG